MYSIFSLRKVGLGILENICQEVDKQRELLQLPLIVWIKKTLPDRRHGKFVAVSDLVKLLGITKALYCRPVVPATLANFANFTMYNFQDIKKNLWQKQNRATSSQNLLQ